MRHVKVDHPLTPIIAALLGAALVGATLVSPATNVAWAQTESSTAANGVLLPPADFDPAVARNENLAESAVVPATSTASDSSADESAPAGTPEAGNSTTTVLGGSDVAVSSVGGSYEVDRPSKRSGRKN
jgi:hypothetical protein